MWENSTNTLTKYKIKSWNLLYTSCILY